MTPAQLEHAQRRMQQKWYELAMAEQRGVAVAVLERMYDAYVLAMEEYNRSCAAYQREQQGQNVPTARKQSVGLGSETASRAADNTKLAS